NLVLELFISLLVVKKGLLLVVCVRFTDNLLSGEYNKRNIPMKGHRKRSFRQSIRNHNISIPPTKKISNTFKVTLSLTAIPILRLSHCLDVYQSVLSPLNQHEDKLPT